MVVTLLSLLQLMIPLGGVFVILSIVCLRCAKTADRIEVLFGVETHGDPRHIILDGSLDAQIVRRGLMQSLPNYVGLLL